MNSLVPNSVWFMLHLLLNHNWVSLLARDPGGPHTQSKWPHNSRGHHICSVDCHVPRGESKSFLSLPLLPPWPASLLFAFQSSHSVVSSSAGPPLGPGQPLLDLSEADRAWFQASRAKTCTQGPLKAIVPPLWKWRE